MCSTFKIWNNHEIRSLWFSLCAQAAVWLCKKNMLCYKCTHAIIGEPYWFTDRIWLYTADGNGGWTRVARYCHYWCHPCYGAMPGLPWSDRRLHYWGWSLMHALYNSWMICALIAWLYWFLYIDREVHADAFVNKWICNNSSDLLKKIKSDQGPCNS